jgi:hypothetical protein
MINDCRDGVSLSIWLRLRCISRRFAAAEGLADFRHCGIAAAIGVKTRRAKHAADAMTMHEMIVMAEVSAEMAVFAETAERMFTESMGMMRKARSSRAKAHMAAGVGGKG